MLAVVTSVLGVYGAWQVMHWGGAAHRTLIGDLFIVPMNLLAVVVVFQAARRSQAQPRVRRSAVLLALGLAFYLLGNILSSVEETLPYAPPSPSMSDVTYLAFYPVAFAALVGLPVARRSLREGLTLALDCAVVTLAASALIWYFSIGPTIAAGGGTVAALAVSLAYPVGDMVLLVGLAALLFTGAPTGMRSTLVLIGAALTALVTTDLVYVWVGLQAEDAGGDLVDVGRMIGLALFAVAAAALPVLSDSDPRPPAVETPPSELAALCGCDRQLSRPVVPPSP